MTRTTDVDGRPRTASRLARWTFDLSVLVAAASAAAMAAMGNGEATIRFGAVAAIMLVARFGDVPAPFASAFAVFMLLATWASVEHWYRQIDHFDSVVHFVTPGSLAAAAYFVLARRRLMPPASHPPGRLSANASVLWVTVVGVTAAVLWEFYEWVMEQVTPHSMIVGYGDTIGDLLAGFLGSFAAGLLVARWAAYQQAPSHPVARVADRL